MEKSVNEQLKSMWLLIRWIVIAYSVIVLIGFYLLPFPDWVMAPALFYTKLIQAILSVILPDAISSVLAIFATLVTPVLIVIYSSSEN